MAWEHAFNQQIFDLTLSEEDVEELRSERTIKHTHVTSEEIEQLSVDESLSPYDRLLYILREGKEVQIIHAINNMYMVIKDEPRQQIENVLSEFKNHMTDSSKDIQIACAKFLLQASDNLLLHGERFASLFAKELLEKLKERDPDLCDEWINAFIGALKILPKRYESEIVTFLKSSGSLTQPMHTRLLCCKLVAHVSKQADSNRLKCDMIPVMKQLCQDIDLDVRACMCGQLDVVVTSLGDQLTRDFLLPELCLLLQDEETNVRLIALETLSKLLSSLNPAVIESSNLRNLAPTFYEKALQKNILVELVACAHFIGKILCSPGILPERRYSLNLIIAMNAHLKTQLDYDLGFLRAEEKNTLMTSYQLLCNQGVEVNKADNNAVVDGSDQTSECRYWCAYNFPAMLVSATPDQITSILVPCYSKLLKDTHPIVRKPLAYSFHEVAKLLTQDVDRIIEYLQTFLLDKDIDVLEGIISGLPSTLGILFCTPTPNLALQTKFTTFFPTLLECEQFLSTSLRWRVHEKFLRNIIYLPELVPSDEIYSKLVPLLFTILGSNKVKPVRLAAGITLLSYIKHNRNIDERNEMCSNFESELAHSERKASRILYLDLCHYVAELFSKNFFKENFYGAAMDLASDSVVNVRLKFCETLPLLKSQIRLPCDRLLLQTLEQIVRRIMAMDNDRDVSNAIRQAITEMDSIRLSMDGTQPTEDDLIDREKEEEEDALTEECIQRKSEKDIKLAASQKSRSISSLDATSKRVTDIKSTSKTSKSASKLNSSKKSGKSTPVKSSSGRSNSSPSTSSSGKSIHPKRFNR